MVEFLIVFLVVCAFFSVIQWFHSREISRLKRDISALSIDLKTQKVLGECQMEMSGIAYGILKRVSAVDAASCQVCWAALAVKYSKVKVALK